MLLFSTKPVDQIRLRDLWSSVRECREPIYFEGQRFIEHFHQRIRGRLEFSEVSMRLRTLRFPFLFSNPVGKHNAYFKDDLVARLLACGGTPAFALRPFGSVFPVGGLSGHSLCGKEKEDDESDLAAN